MKGKNYEYDKDNGRTVLKLLSTDALTRAVLDIDQYFLEGTLRDQQPSKKVKGWIGKCPFCSHVFKSKKHSHESYLPAYLTCRDTGYVFHCCACKTDLTTFKFLLNAHGEDRAQEYAQRRWDSGELCGGGWNCPLPQKVRKDLLDAKEKRRDAYKQDYEANRQLNYQKRYGS